MSYGYEHENEHQDDDEDEGSWTGVLLVGAAVGAMVVGLVWVGTWWLSPSDPEPEPRQDAVPARQVVDDPVPDPTEASETTSPLDRCLTVHDAQQAPLRAATGSLTQWEVHIGAMNKLVVGAITLQQARQFWNDTREGAHAKLHEFATARRHYDQRIYRCPAPRPAAAEANPALGTCHRAVAADGRTIRLATIALGTWERHVHHMDMLRRGEMTAQQAGRLWLQNWREGDREVQAYRAAARTGRGLTC